MVDISGLSETEAFEKAREAIATGQNVPCAVHVMLDLAFNATQPQLRLWAQRFLDEHMSVKIRETDNETPGTSDPIS